MTKQNTPVPIPALGDSETGTKWASAVYEKVAAIRTLDLREARSAWLNELMACVHVRVARAPRDVESSPPSTALTCPRTQVSH